MVGVGSFSQRRLLAIVMLVSFCGGPLFICNLLKPRIGPWPALLIGFLPLAAMYFGSRSLNDDGSSRWSSIAVRAGLLGLFITLGMNLYALWCFARGVHVIPQSLHYVGMVVGVAWSVYYLPASRPWWRPAADTYRPGDPPSPKPIEPS